jgi:hypothetical protein
LRKPFENQALPVPFLLWIVAEMLATGITASSSIEAFGKYQVKKLSYQAFALFTKYLPNASILQDNK